MGRSVSDLVRVYTAPSRMDAYLVKARLEDEGVPAMIQGDGPYPAGLLTVWVPTGSEPQARLVVDAIGRGDYALTADDIEGLENEEG